jgi:hypothetical protein
VADFDLLTLAELHEADLRTTADAQRRRAERPRRRVPASIRGGLTRILRVPLTARAAVTAGIRRAVYRGQLGPRPDLEIDRHVAWI